MAGDNETKIVITAKDNVSSAIKKISDALGNTGLGQSITAASTAFMALKQAGEMVGAAIGVVTDQFSKAIEEASKMEDTHRKLALAYLSTGEYTKEAFEATVKWSDEIERATGMEGEAVLKLVSLAKNYGLTADKSKEAAEAAVNLAAAMGTDADTAIRQLSMTLQGNAGRLARMVPELANLTEAQLRSGAAIDIVKQKYVGFAEAASNTFSGAMTKMHTQIGNVYESFGKMIVQNPAVISAINAIADGAANLAEKILELSNWFLNNIETIKSYALAFGIAVTAVGAYIVAMNAATIAQTAWTVALIAFNTAAKLTPLGWIALAVTALTVAIGYLIDNWEKVIAVIQKYVGVALQKVIQVIKFVTQAHLALVSVFSKDLANSIKKTLNSLEEYGKEMEANGDAAIKAADAAKVAGKSQADAADIAANATKGLEGRIDASAQAVQRLRSEYSKLSTEAKDAFAGVKDLTPSIQLGQLKKDAELWKSTLKELESKAIEIQKSMSLSIGPPKAEDVAFLAKVKEDQTNAHLALKAVDIKIANETREAKIKQVEIQLQQEKSMNISAAQEIMMKRIEFQNQLRTQLVAIETQRLLEERGIRDADARNGIDVKTAAALQANEVELNAYKAHLDAQMNLAVTMETQKQQALAAAKASATSGLGGSAEAAGGADAAVANEEARQARLTELRNQGLMDEQRYQKAMTESVIIETNARTQQELALQQERAAMLGLSQDALNARLESARLESQMQLEIINQRYADNQMTDQEYQTAVEENERAHKARMNEINEQFYMDSAAQHERLGEDWEATLDRIRAAYEAHGSAMEAILAAQGSKQYQGSMTMLSNLSSLRNSHSKKAFEVGKKAAIAETTIKTFMGAMEAYTALVGIPIVGPVLAPIAAAAALAAGFVQIQNIQAQQFNPGGQAHGGLDEVPASMDNKTFLLSAGERVIQPEANKDLTQAAETINSGKAGGGGNVFNITVHGDPNKETLSKLKSTIIDAIRSESERGAPIIHEKGIVRA